MAVSPKGRGPGTDSALLQSVARNERRPPACPAPLRASRPDPLLGGGPAASERPCTAASGRACAAAACAFMRPGWYTAQWKA